MFSPEEVIKIHKDNGAEILAPLNIFTTNFKIIKGIILDWDGVFTNGIKGENDHTGFSEMDSMGLNLLRYALWNRVKIMPQIFIVTGMNNPSAVAFAKRESLTAVYQGLKQKDKAIQHIKANFNTTPKELICVFDDVLDLAMAKDCALRFLVNRKANPLFIKYVKNKRWCDYITVSNSGENPVREICEFLIGISGNYEKTLDDRINFSANYSQYLEEKKAIEVKNYEL
jgi:3-deoxy-D-manno-octulosonate 8-phosphate phosphatase (KDO 8-P phosphatase)